MNEQPVRRPSGKTGKINLSSVLELTDQFMATRCETPGCGNYVLPWMEGRCFPCQERGRQREERRAGFLDTLSEQAQTHQHGLTRRVRAMKSLGWALTGLLAGSMVTALLFFAARFLSGQ